VLAKAASFVRLRESEEASEAWLAEHQAAGVWAFNQSPMLELDSKRIVQSGALRVKSRAVAAQDLANCGVWTRSAPGLLAHLCGNEEGSLVDRAFRLSPSQGPRAI
jgi:hypothetical protein